MFTKYISFLFSFDISQVSLPSAVNGDKFYCVYNPPEQEAHFSFRTLMFVFTGALVLQESEGNWQLQAQRPKKSLSALVYYQITFLPTEAL
jgi:hypothetical protein